MLVAMARAQDPAPVPGRQQDANAIQVASPLPLDLTHRPGTATNRMSLADIRSAAPATDASLNARSPRRLTAAMAAAANVGVLQSGVARTKEALVECQRGDYPGGGQGVLSLPFARPAARTDHCWR